MPNAYDSPTVTLFDDQIAEKPEPMALFLSWLDEARESEVNDPNAMSLATVDASGMPDCRMVLLNGFSPDGFVFFTNNGSAKGNELAANPRAALLFHWKSLRRQVRVRGPVEPVSGDEADTYFASRARGSQLGAHVSAQSRPLAARADLEARVADLGRTYDGAEVPRPDYWSGYRVLPLQMEFWQNGEFRLHDRVVYRREDPGGAWTAGRLNP